ncbi:MAG: NAD(P)-binding domain-containing protein [Candidatus Bathyarchaeota archaeon]|nr:NAD(P)-binding domain-containing protein [Candidatus Bathyarchaeota archaeon]
MVAPNKKFGVEIFELEEVVSLDLKGARKIVKTKKATYEAQVVVIASGAVGSATGQWHKGEHILVVGGGNSAAITAAHIVELLSEVKLAHRRMLRAEEACEDA